MDESRSFQVHANVNADHGDSALRVSITFYDETGHQVAHQTWRKHVRAQVYEGSAWQAYSALVDMAKMMGEICSTEVEIDTPDNPLPGL